MNAQREQFRNELVERREIITLLESLEGYKRLSDNQQKLIKVSLLFQQRAKREDTDTVKYAKSRAVYADLFKNIYCHLAALYVEEDLPIDTPRRDRFPEKEILRNAEYLESANPSLSQIENYVESKGFPQTILISTDTTYIDPDTREKVHAKGALHTCIALGKTNAGIIIWEKATRGEPFNLIPLADVYARYKRYQLVKDQYWATRRLLPRANENVSAGVTYR